VADPVGIRRPNLADLLEHDDYSIICVDLRTFIRAAFAAAHDRVSVWQLPPLPETQECPVPEQQAPGRGTRTHRQ
jgi:hypothetical protein